MSESIKRLATSPLSGDEEDLKRRIIMEEAPILITLDEVTGDEEQDDSLNVGSAELSAVLQGDSKPSTKPEETSSERVDRLIERMDKFMECFASLHSTVSKNQSHNQRNLKRLETAHNDMVNKVVKSAETTENRLESLESKLEESLSENAKLASKVARLEDEHSHKLNLQRQRTEENSKKIKDLDVEHGFTVRNLHDCRSEVKEWKIIISGIAESTGEDVKLTALNKINKVIETAINSRKQDNKEGLLRKLKARDIDNVFRIGKNARGSRKRNISVTFLSSDDKEMVLSAKLEVKDSQEIKYFFNEDVSNDGRVLKANLKRIAHVANSQGNNAKASGNKVSIGSRTYYSNELHLIPPEVSQGLKFEKEIKDGIIYKGEKSTFSNFSPAPFSLNGVDYLHVEQYFQHAKATQHNEFQLADRIMRLSNPRRIKTLGDGIEVNAAWLEGRMMVLYHGVKAKFEQNWALQDELISTKGKQLYEATTDPYFACGLSYESKKWSDHDWPGENVAGLVLMKVRDELSSQPSGIPISDTTLGEIAVEENLESCVNMDVGEKSMNNSVTYADISTSTVVDQTSSMSGKTQSDDADSLSANNTSNVSATPINQSQSSSSGMRGSNRRGRGRGSGRGRGRGGRGFHPQSGNPSSIRKPKYRMSTSERSFLCGEDRISENNHRKHSHSSNSVSKQINWSNPLGLNEAQIKGLEILGFSLSNNQNKMN